MARIRSIKPEFFTSEQIVECSPIARLMFVGMWCFCDDAGIFPASYKSLKMQVFPGDEVTINQIKSYVEELLKAELLVQYVVENKTYWQVTGWHHQKIDRPNYKYPKPENSTSDRRVIDDHSPPEWSGVESIGVEKNTTLPSACAKNSENSAFRKIFEAGIAVFPNLAPLNTSSIQKWIAAGCDPELDAVPVIQRVAKAGKPVRSWSYFDGAVMDAKATREKPLPEGKPHEQPQRNSLAKPTWKSEADRLRAKYREDAEREEQGAANNPAGASLRIAENVRENPS